jgi:uncharacterized membrane protein
MYNQVRISGIIVVHCLHAIRTLQNWKGIGSLTIIALQHLYMCRIFDVLDLCLGRTQNGSISINGMSKLDRGACTVESFYSGISSVGWRGGLFSRRMGHYLWR